ncbi:MAG: hypothetical protein E6K11_06005, partial [Methanobacteriota archaeon]
MTRAANTANPRTIPRFAHAHDGRGTPLHSSLDVQGLESGLCASLVRSGNSALRGFTRGPTDPATSAAAALPPSFIQLVTKHDKKDDTYTAGLQVFSRNVLCSTYGSIKLAAAVTPTIATQRMDVGLGSRTHSASQPAEAASIVFYQVARIPRRMAKRDLLRRKVEDIEVARSAEVARLVESMGRGGGFTAKKIAVGVDILRTIFRRRSCTTFLSFPAALMATGVRGVLRTL